MYNDSPNGGAKRRQMRYVMWTLLAICIPNADRDHLTSFCGTLCRSCAPVAGMSKRQNCHSVRTGALRRSQRARNVTSRFCPGRRNGLYKAPACRRYAVHFEICGMRLARFRFFDLTQSGETLCRSVNRSPAILRQVCNKQVCCPYRIPFTEDGLAVTCNHTKKPAVQRPCIWAIMGVGVPCCAAEAEVS